MSWRSTGNHRSSGAGAGRQEVLCRRRLLVKALPLALVLFYFVLSFENKSVPLNGSGIVQEKQQPLIDQTTTTGEEISNSTTKLNKLIHHKDQDYPLYPTSPLKGYPQLQAKRPACEAALDRGFWQRMQPVPFEKWKFLNNLTCTPQNDEALQSWQKRVPSTVILGTQKGGTTALAYYLYNHPSVVYLPLKELHVFDEDLDALQEMSSTQLNQTALLHYYQHDVIGSMVNLSQFRLDPNKQALDATPNYLYASDRTIPRLLCAAPWVKLIVLLRNPIDRAFSQYHMQYHRDLRHPEYRKQHNSVLSFDEFVDLDLQVLDELGITSSTTFPEDGWREYTKWGLNAPVGRGLYWIQLQHLFETMKQYQKPSSDLLILQSERYRQFPNETYQQVLEFLNLPHFELPQYGTDIHKTQYGSFHMKESTKAKLEQFYAPHNAKLADLLGDEWRDVWK